MSITHILSFLNVYASALFVGSTAWILVVEIPAMRHMSTVDSVRTHKVQLHEYPDKFFPILQPFVNLTAAGVLIANHDPSSAAFVLESIGLVLSLAVTAVTLLINVPINKLVAKLSLDQIPPNYPELRRRWDRVHAVRTLLGAIAFGCFLGAALAL